MNKYGSKATMKYFPDQPIDDPPKPTAPEGPEVPEPPLYR